MTKAEGRWCQLECRAALFPRRLPRGSEVWASCQQEKFPWQSVPQGPDTAAGCRGSYRLALNQLRQVSHMLYATQPAFQLRYAERLTCALASACARFYSRRRQSLLSPPHHGPWGATKGKPTLSSEDVLCRLILSKHGMGIQGYRWASTVENVNKIEWEWIWCRVCVLES